MKMKQIILLCLILLVVGVLSAAEPIAYLIQAKGSMQIMRDQKALKFKNGELLYNNDEIRTSGESFAAIKYMDGGAAIKVFPNSVVKLSATKNGKQLNKNTSLQLGSLYSKVNNKIKGNYQVETPTTVASVKGTGFVTKLGSKKETIVIVFEGEVLLQHKESGKSKSVSPGMTGTSDVQGNVGVEKTKIEDVSEREMQEIEATNQESQKTMKIQVTDDNGHIKYIQITY
jgi:hypothetical protein